MTEPAKETEVRITSPEALVGNWVGRSDGYVVLHKFGVDGTLAVHVTGVGGSGAGHPPAPPSVHSLDSGVVYEPASRSLPCFFAPALADPE